MRLAAVLLAGCAANVDRTPPAPGAAKGCRTEADFDGPLAGRLGLSSHIEWGASDEDADWRAFEVDGWLEMGVGNVRRDLTWSTLEPARGTFDWAPADRLMEALGAAGAEPVALLCYGNPWAASGATTDTTPPDDPADFANYAGALAARYGDQVRWYEVWNEENEGLRFWQPEEDPAAYGALLLAAADAVHAADPDAQVVLGGLFLPDLVVGTPGAEFLEQVATAVPDVATAIDGVAVHPYRYPFTAPEHSDTDQASLVDELCALHDELDTLGLPDRLFVTELGWHTAPDALFPGVSDQDQAAYLVRSAVLAFSQGVEIFDWYTFRDSGDSDTDQEQRFGLYGYAPTPPAPRKPAVAAYRALAEALGTHDRIVDTSVELGLDADVYAYRLEGGSGTTWVAWTTGETSVLRIPGGGPGTELGLDGTQRSLGEGPWDIEVSGTPVFVLAP